MSVDVISSSRNAMSKSMILFSLIKSGDSNGVTISRWYLFFLLYYLIYVVLFYFQSAAADQWHGQENQIYQTYAAGTA